MLLVRQYDRAAAKEYAERWAFERNPLFADFDALGGNCTNFVSQCLLAGCCTMNYRALFGWYYISADDRTPSWSGVEYFYRFILGNAGEGPFGRECKMEELEIGDVIQLAKEEGFYHSLLVAGFSEENVPLVAAQSTDAYMRPLSSYEYGAERCIKIEGVRVKYPSIKSCFERLIEGREL